MTCILNIYTLQNDVNNDYRNGSRERMREERSRRARRGGGRERERERERERQKNKEAKKRRHTDVNAWGVMSPSRTHATHIAPPFHSTSNCSWRWLGVLHWVGSIVFSSSSSLPPPVSPPPHLSTVTHPPCKQMLAAVVVVRLLALVLKACRGDGCTCHP